MNSVGKVFKLLLAVTCTGMLLLGMRGTAAGSKGTKAKAAQPAPAASGETKAAASTVRVVALSVTEKGFEPSPVKVKQGEPLKLIVTRKTDNTCATDIVVQGYDVRAALPLNTPVEVSFTPKKTGTLSYGCAMDQMVSGVLLVE